jgi:hypothetical protein
MSGCSSGPGYREGGLSGDHALRQSTECMGAIDYHDGELVAHKTPEDI